MKVLLINGPPRSGKDSFGAALQHHAGIEHIGTAKFAQPLREALRNLFGVDEEQLEREKDRPLVALHGRTPREVMIALSEKFYKPTFGADVFGRIMAANLMRTERNGKTRGIAVTDSGFLSEAQPVFRAFPLRVRVVRLHREGESFSNDSRISLDSWMLPKDVESFDIDIDNNGTKQDLYRAAAPFAEWLISGD